MRCSVLHLGVPLGWVDLPDNRGWAGGLLEPTPAYESVGETLRNAARLAGVPRAAALWRLASGEHPDEGGLSPAAADALRRAAALEFELKDEEGRRIAADVVRVVDLDDGVGARVKAYFESVTSGIPAPIAPFHRRVGEDNDWPGGSPSG